MQKFCFFIAQVPLHSLFFIFFDYSTHSLESTNALWHSSWKLKKNNNLFKDNATVYQQYSKRKNKHEKADKLLEFLLFFLCRVFTFLKSFNTSFGYAPQSYFQMLNFDILFKFSVMSPWNRKNFLANVTYVKAFKYTKHFFRMCLKSVMNQKQTKKGNNQNILLGAIAS